MTFYTALIHGLISSKNRIPLNTNTFDNKKFPIITYGTQGETTYPDFTIGLFMLYSQIYGNNFLREITRALIKNPVKYSERYTITNEHDPIQHAVKAVFDTNSHERLIVPQNKFRVFTNTSDEKRQPFDLHLQTNSEGVIGRFSFLKSVINSTLTMNHYKSLKIRNRRNYWPAQFQGVISADEFVSDFHSYVIDIQSDWWANFEYYTRNISEEIIRYYFPLSIYKTGTGQIYPYNGSLSHLIQQLKNTENETFEGLFVISCKAIEEQNLTIYDPEIYNLQQQQLQQNINPNIKFRKNMEVRELEQYVKNIAIKRKKRKQKKQRQQQQQQRQQQQRQQQH